jgi:UDP-2,3-diacylglucosamine hydrolase
METPSDPKMRIGLIAGSGQFPFLFSKKAKAKGYRVFAVAHLKETDPELGDLVDGIQWLHLGQLGKLIRFFKKHDVKQAVMMGAIEKTRVFRDIRPDLKILSIIGSLKNSHDDRVLRACADVLKKEGIEILASTFLLPEILAPEGCWTQRKPSPYEAEHIEFGWQIAKEIGRLDIGQCIVVGDGSVLAVEAVEGTDETIRRGGKLASGNAVVIKICKPDQDLRFDIPAIGLETIETMSTAGATVLTVEAGKAVVFDKEEMIRLADRHNISIVAIDDRHGDLSDSF